MGKKIMCIILIVILLITGCENDSKGEKDTKHVVVTSYVLADFAKQLGGAQFKTTVLLSPGENPKKHELTQRDVNFINHADIFIYNGSVIDPWVEGFIISNDFVNDSLTLIDASKGIKLRDKTYADKTLDTDYVLYNVNREQASASSTLIPEHNSEEMYLKDKNGDIMLDENFEPVLKDTDARAETPDIEGAGNKPNKKKEIQAEIDCSNIWMSPENAGIMVKNIYDGLYDAADGLDMDVISSSYREYSESIKVLGERIKLIAGNSGYRFVIIEGKMDCFYLLDYIGFNYMSVSRQDASFEQDIEKRKAFILEFIKKNPAIKYMLSENVTSETRIASSIKRYEINSMSNIEKKNYNRKEFSYYEIMQRNCEILKNVI